MKLIINNYINIDNIDNYIILIEFDEGIYIINNTNINNNINLELINENNINKNLIKEKENSMEDIGLINLDKQLILIL